MTTDRLNVAVQFDDADQQQLAATLGMWTFLATEILFFGGMIAGYVVYRTRYPAAWAAGSLELDLWWGTANTAILLTSSLTMALAVSALGELVGYVFGQGHAMRRLGPLEFHR